MHTCAAHVVAHAQSALFTAVLGNLTGAQKLVVVLINGGR